MLKVLVTVLSLLAIIATHMLSVPVQGQQGEIDRAPWKKTVRVENDLVGSNFTQLLVHCRSGDDDLGVHYLTVGQFVEWTFNDNFWGRTLFWCNLAWNDVQKSIEVYKSKDDYIYCGAQCWRSIRPDGAYFYEGLLKSHWKKRYSW